jgi:2-phospho-L-lactate guanylyltransferase
VKLAILIPCKDFNRGKSRLAACLPSPARVRLCEFFLCRTLEAAVAAAGRRCVHVIAGDPRVAAVAAAHGVAIIDDGGAGLNGALMRARAKILSEARNCAALIVPIDLPLVSAGALARIAALPNAAAIVPDEAGAGTNILRLDAAVLAAFPFAYGPRSHARHAAAARLFGIEMRRIEDPDLMFDVDRPEHYRRWAPSDPAWCAVMAGDPAASACGGS